MMFRRLSFYLALAGIVPFACKLPMALITNLHECAKADDVSMNELVAGLLTAALEKPKAKATKKAAASTE